MSCPSCGAIVRGTRSAPVLVQLAARLVRGVPRLRRGVEGGRSIRSWRSAHRDRDGAGAAARMARGRRGGAVPDLPRARGSIRSRGTCACRGGRSTNSRRCPVRGALALLGKLKFDARSRSRSPQDILPEIEQRLHFMGQVGLDYLALEPLGEDAQRRREPAHPARGAARLESARRALRARRADHRPASARQRSAARHARRA